MTTPTRSSGKVVNLCLHGIGAPSRKLEPDEEMYWIDEATFEGVLDVVESDSQFRLSFDDGNESDASIVLPALVERGLTASFFVIGERLATSGSLGFDDVRQLAEAGMAVGLHGFRHQRWRTVDDVTLAGDLEQAKRLVAETTGRIPRSVSCPFGSYDRRVLALLRRLGFSRVYTVDRRPAREDAWLQPRFTVMSTDTPDDVLAHARISAAASVTRLAKSGFKRWR